MQLKLASSLSCSWGPLHFDDSNQSSTVQPNPIINIISYMLNVKCHLGLRILLIIISILTFSPIGKTFAFNEDPKQQFDMTNNRTNKTSITFRQANNVTAECDKESRSRGQGGFGIQVDACSFWNFNLLLGTDECLIITAKRANFHTLGHELRHCIQENWHK